MRKASMLLFFTLQFLYMNSQPVNNRILVVSGGGSRGAWGAGYAKFLSDSFGEYNVAFGTSTGSLMNPLILLGKFDELKKGYTTVTQKKIFDKNPFKTDGNLRWTVLLRVLFGKKTLGESNNLRKLIDTFLLDCDYKKIRESKKVFGVAVIDFKTSDISTKFSNQITDPKIMKDWIWASSNQPLFMTYFHPKNSGYFVDGGVRETVPVMAALQYAIDHHITDIDVIINQPKYPIINREFKPKRIFDGLMRLIEIWRTEVIDNDVLLALQAASINNCNEGDKITIHPHYFPTDLFKSNENDLIFDSTKMSKLWEIGTQGIEDGPEEFIDRPKTIKICPAAANDYFLKLKKYREKMLLQ